MWRGDYLLLRNMCIINKNRTTEWVKLPSKGKCYPLLTSVRQHGAIEMYCPIVNDEKLFKLDGDNVLKKIDKILKCYNVDQTFDIETLCDADWGAVFVWLDENIGLLNSNDSQTIKDVKKDINEAEKKMIYTDANGFSYYVFDNGDVLVFKSLTYKQKRDMDGNFDEKKAIIKHTVKITDMTYEKEYDISSYVSNLDENTIFSLYNFIKNNTF